MSFQSLAALKQTTYDRAACVPGIVHVGYGAFHRAHQAVYVDDYMQTTGDLNWGIVAVNLRASESPSFEAAQPVDGYLLKTTSPEGREDYRLVRSHIDFIDAAHERGAAEVLLDLPSIHAVTVTVTESGYYLDDTGTELNLNDPAIKAEVQGGPPETIYGYLARGLEQRAAGSGQPLTILCCDNIRGNGKMLRRCMLAYLTATGRASLAEWVAGNVSFPCSMVDRITPRSDDALTRDVAIRFPGHEATAIGGEAFIQWVLEDNFAGPMPDLARAGVEVVADVDPYEEAKIRILNGGHSGLCYLGALAGHSTFDAAMADPALRRHFDGWEYDNVLPGLTLDLPFDKRAYCDKVADRFCNAAISDRLERICMDGWSKIPIYIRPTLDSCLSQGITPTYGFDCVASWYVYARRVAAGVMPVAYVEPYWDQLEPLLAAGREDDFARTTALWDKLPETYENFVPGITAAIRKVEDAWPV